MFPGHTKVKRGISSHLDNRSGNSTNGTGTNNYQVILDSGTTLAYLPPPIADAVAALYVPPGVWNRTSGVYNIPCNAQIPNFAVRIGGVDFPVDKKDMIMPTADGGCQSGISNGGIYAPYVLGDTFMKNVVVVFDVGSAKLAFRKRTAY